MGLFMNVNRIMDEIYYCVIYAMALLHLLARKAHRQHGVPLDRSDALASSGTSA